ncbi:hypothetical protein C8R44DRAFT_886637 [Mycena epipterygia]|nr:hypothetical protein C8R44DRAFT_886637 [Mycena epipterygia]
MSPSCLPAELWDHIIDLLDGSPTDFKSCSLVCRSFVARAQSYIFRQIWLHEWNATEIACALLSSLSYIVPSVRFLFIGKCDPETMSMLVQRRMWTAEELYRIFAYCTVQVQHIEFRNFRVDPSFAPAPLQGVQRSQIRQLSLLQEVGLGGLLSDPACPLDFSAVTDVHCEGEGCATPAIRVFILRARSTIERLHFRGTDERMKFLDLSHFPALKHIRCDETGPTFHHLLSTLAPTNTVETLHIVLSHRAGHDLESVENTIVAAKTAALQRVEVEVKPPPILTDEITHGPTQRLIADKEMANRLNAGLPRLRNNGLLHIRVIRA